MRVIVALAPPRSDALVDELTAEAHIGIACSDASRLTEEALHDADVLVIDADHRVVTASLVALCDRSGTRILVIGHADARRLSRFGLPEPLPDDAQPWDIVAAIEHHTPRPAEHAVTKKRRVITVWGTSGSPGRSTIAIELAVALSSPEHRVALVDADSFAPSLALLLGLDDDSPGLAAACRRAEVGALDVAELDRISHAFDTCAGPIDVLVGVNRPSRWPELSFSRVHRTLSVSREWADDTIVDVASSLESDEDLASDMPGPQRAAATRASLECADHVIAVAAADPLAIARFVRDYAELRNIIGSTPVTVVVNLVRPGPLGVDARGQIRRTLERFCGIDDVVFLPYDRRAADASLLHARPMADVTPRAAVVRAIRVLADKISTHKAPAATDDSAKESSRVARRLRPKRAARATLRRADDRASAS